MTETYVDLATILIGSGVSIACFVTGDLPCEAAAPMPRVPSFPVGQAFDADFRHLFDEATLVNPSIHDGAVFLSRRGLGTPYVVAGWSYRLFPPQVEASRRPNMGSAFNSCLHMSLVQGVDFVVKPSEEFAFLFERGDIRRVAPKPAEVAGFGRV